MSKIRLYTPYMKAYSEKFSDSGSINWLPYLMYFHPYSYQSDVVSTDHIGFRYSEARGQRYSVGDMPKTAGVRLIAGSSTVFGIGASNDRHTLASRLTENDPRDEFWLNFGGRSFNATQEWILFSLNRHLLKDVREIVLFSGFNDLGLARLPKEIRMEHGAFFNCNEFFESMTKRKHSKFNAWFNSIMEDGNSDEPPPLELQLAYASELVTRHLANWKALADNMGAKLTFVLQPLSNWVRSSGSPEEQEIFSELEAMGSFEEIYGDILSRDICNRYSYLIEEEARRMGVQFLNFSPVLSEAIDDDEWVFADRIHFNDRGHDIVSKILLNYTS